MALFAGRINPLFRMNVSLSGIFSNLNLRTSISTNQRTYSRRSIGTSTKYLSISSNVQAECPSGFEEWTPVYRFHHIIFARMIQRFKLYQTGITCGILLPWTLVLSYQDTSNVSYFYYILGASTLACIMLGVMGTMASRLIGIIYVNKKDPNQLRLARLSFFGSRIDEYIPADIFVPLSDSSKNYNDAYIVLDTIDEEKELRTQQYPFIGEFLPAKKYYLSLRFGTILDKDAFTHIFGGR